MDINDIGLNYQHILDSLNDGIYVVDLDRKIVFWGGAAELITGWTSEDIVGKHCHDDVLCHHDKDGRQLCGKEYCPLHRSMITATGSTAPMIVFAQRKDGQRVPMRVSVAPIKNSAGEVIGGVETFRNLSEEIGDYLRAKHIQELSLPVDLPEDNRISFNAHYSPHDIVGGDYYAIKQVSDNCYGFLLADVCGHGISAALYTMYLNSLWKNNCELFYKPAEFTQAMSKGFASLVNEYEPFATAITGVIDLANWKLQLSGAGNPPPLLFRSDGTYEPMRCPGLPLGSFAEATYQEIATDITPGDHLLLFTDGAIEINNFEGLPLGTEGLVEILQSLQYPDLALDFNTFENAILMYSDRIRFDDDLTFLEISLSN